MPGTAHASPADAGSKHGAHLLLSASRAQLIYVGSAESDQHDQLLDQVLVGPMQVRASRPAASDARSVLAGLNAQAASACRHPSIARREGEDRLS